MQVKICPSCDKQVPVGSSNCENCGAPLTNETDATIAADLPRKRRSDSPTSFGDGRYRAIRFLGQGASKVVYLVHDTLLDREVALALIKTFEIDDRDRDLVLREAQTMARVGDHPNVVPIYDFGEDSGQPFMVMPVMAGGTVADTIGGDVETGEQDIAYILKTASEICLGLEYLHTNGVIHRDLKPRNVWLTGDGVARIGDFGIAHSAFLTRVTSDDIIRGTVAYMAPEQATDGEVNERTDLYSLGIILYEMVTGRTPFLGDHPVAIISQHINNRPIPPSEMNQRCPPKLESLILRLLGKEPSVRPESAAEVLATIQTIMAEEPGTVPGINTVESKRLRALIVEDSEDDAFLISRELQRGNYTVTVERVETAEGMKAALERETWDIVVSDFSMPHFSAPAALKLLQNTGLDIPFIIASGTISEEMAVTAMKAGAHDYVMKDNLARLNPAVERELNEAEVRRARRRAENEERRLYRELQEKHQEIEDRVASLTSDKEQLQKQLDHYTTLVQSYLPILERLRSLATNLDSLNELMDAIPPLEMLDPRRENPGQNG